MNKKKDQVEQIEMQLLFTIDQANKILGGMPESTIRKFVKAGALKRYILEIGPGTSQLSN